MKNWKNWLRFLGVIALAMVIGFSLIACSTGDGGSEDEDLSGDVTIAPTGTVKVGTELTASYSGDEDVSFQWNKSDAAIDSATSAKYTPTAAGSYTVTVSAEGYKSKTSAAVTVTVTGEEAKPREVVLGDFTVENGDTQKGWCTDGTDDKKTDLTIEDLQAAKYLVLELSAAPSGGMQIIFQADGNSWGWDESVILTDAGGEKADMGTSFDSDGTTLTIELSKAIKNYEKLATSTKAKIIIAYYSQNIDDLGIEKAYLVIYE